MNNPRFLKWLATQPEEFVNDVVNNKKLGDELFTVDKLRELDAKFNPEDEDERSTN